MVKKAAQAIPNQLLRRARLERGWMQSVVAERIGAPHDLMVSRWERGTAFPSAYYIERLCQLFDLKASDLGLLPASPPMASSHPLADRGRRPGSSEERAKEPVSSMPPLPRSASPLSQLPLVGRAADMRVLQDCYQAAQQGQLQVVTIQGEAGIGKYVGYGACGWAESRLGKHEEGMQSMERAQTISQRLGGQLMFQDTFTAVMAELLFSAGRVEEALACAEAAVKLANGVGGILSAGLAQRVWGQALMQFAHWEEAEAHLAESCQTLLSGENLLEAARTQVAWGLLCRDRGDTASAQGHWEQAAAQFEASGLTRELDMVRHYLAQLGL
jgi:transcriptional regulator with XRE-family HTH domain